MVEGGTWFPWLVQLLDDFAPNTAGIVHGIYPNYQLFATLRFSSSISSFQVAWQPDALWFEFRGYWSFTVEFQCCHVFHKVESKCSSRRDDQTLTCFLKSFAHGSIGCWFCAYYIKQSEYRMQEVLPTDLYILVLGKSVKFHLCGPNAVYAVQNSDTDCVFLQTKDGASRHWPGSQFEAAMDQCRTTGTERIWSFLTFSSLISH